ncbi:TRAP-type C4-dicarboxylate transport system permease small subunit [Neobacillus niacini]|uniref:TRAP transporter small permease n=1 Tax=Neobacillus niacini TaxID=86668 RepID=UPI00285D84EE|nr:TRAP transporter small permease [Neobacillus niacini]MDR7080019.1 TRAP-type C4-dicarboxylate transport system permease small subunit [Neobacillus niacini]
MWTRVKNLLLNLDDIIASLTFIGITAITIIGVFMRYVLNSPFEWIEEVSLLLFVWFAFIGISAVTKRDEHVGIDYFVRKLHGRTRVAVDIFREINIFIVVIFVFIYLGMNLSTHALDKLTPVLGIRYTFVDIAVPIGGLLALMHMIRKRITKEKSEN